MFYAASRRAVLVTALALMAPSVLTTSPAQSVYAAKPIAGTDISRLLAELGESIAAMERGTEADRTKTAELEARLAEAERKITALNGNTTDLQAAVAQLTNRVAALGQPPQPVPGPVVTPLPQPAPGPVVTLPPDPVPQPIPDPVPPAPAPSADNALTIRNVSGAALVNYPLQFGRPFVPGEIMRCPQIVGDGTPVATQADVKKRYADGSVSHAVIAGIIPQLPAGGTVTLQFQDQPCSNEPLATAQMLEPAYDFDAVIQLSVPDKPAASVSARAMLEAGACAPWTQGQVAQTMICADDGAERRYDTGFSEHRSFRPRFYVTFWPATRQVAVRYVGEVSNSEALEAFAYDLTLTLGHASPQTAYTQAGIKHSIGTRWTRGPYWLGGTPEVRVNVDHNLAYLAATRALPNYDTSVTVPESVIAADYARWLTKDRSVGGAGLWNKYMPSTGGREDIAPVPGWTARWLYTGDWRTREIALTQADLAGAWDLHVREGDPAKHADRGRTVPGLGRPVTVYGRPTLWMFNSRDAATVADKLAIVGPPSLAEPGKSASVDAFRWSDWIRDGAHQADPFFAQYILTGDPFYLEGMQLWAGGQSVSYNPCVGASHLCRGPGAGINDQVRGEAWALRNRANAAFATPDSDPLKIALTDMVVDALARWEGMRDIRGTPLEGTPMWNQGKSLAGAYWGVPGMPPLRWWAPISPAYTVTNPAIFNTEITGAATAGWMQNYVIWALGRAAELGFPAQGLLSWIAPNIIGQVTDPGYNPHLVGEYIIPTAKKGPPVAWFSSWAEALAGWAPALQATTKITYYPDAATYFTAARAAAALAATEPGGDAAWQSFEAMIAAHGPIKWGDNPAWAIIPRGQ